MGRTSLSSDKKDMVFDKTLQRYTSKRQIFRLSSEVSEILDEVEDKSRYIRDAIVFYHTHKDQVGKNQIKDKKSISTRRTIGYFSDSDVSEKSESEDPSTGTWNPPWKSS